MSARLAVCIIFCALIFIPQRASAQAPTAEQLAAAMDVPASNIVSVQLVHSPSAASRRIATDWGTVLVPQSGPTMAAFSTGIAADKNDAGYVSPQRGTAFDALFGVPPVVPPVPRCVAPAEAWDVTELRLVLRVPIEATGFTFDYNYLSADYPEFVCQPFAAFSDVFAAMLTSAAFNGNIAYDAQGNFATSNSAFFAAPDSVGAGPLAGTGMEDIINGQIAGGATMWVRTTAPVVGGETITLHFILYDGDDPEYDSQVLLDNFKWVIPGAVNTPPIADAGADIKVPGASCCLTPVTLNGGGSSDADRDALTYAWSGPFGSAAGVTATVSLGVGVHSVVLTVADGRGGVATDEVIVAVVDTTSERLDTFEGALAAHDARLATHDLRLESYATEIANHTSQLAGFAVQFGALSADVGSHGTSLAAHAAHLDAHHAEIARMKAEIASLVSTNQTQQTQITALQAAVAALKADVDTIMERFFRSGRSRDQEDDKH
jgi:hypothetical protein